MLLRLVTRTVVAVGLAVGTFAAFGTAASADGGGCPAAAGWLRVGDVPAGTTSVTVSAPAGQGIVETCLWTGTEHQLLTYDPAASSAVIAPFGTPAEGEPALTVVAYAYRLITLDLVPAEPSPAPSQAPAVPAPAPPQEPAPVPTQAPAAAAPAPGTAPTRAATSDSSASSVPPAPDPAPVPAADAVSTPTVREAASTPTPPVVEVAAGHVSAVVRPSGVHAAPAADGHPSAAVTASLGALVLLGGGVIAVTGGRRRAMACTPA